MSSKKCILIKIFYRGLTFEEKYGIIYSVGRGEYTNVLKCTYGYCSGGSLGKDTKVYPRKMF